MPETTIRNPPPQGESYLLSLSVLLRSELPGRPWLRMIQNTTLKNQKPVSIDRLVSLFASLFAIPLACQCCLHATLFTGLQIVGVTLHFLDNVLLLYL